MIILRTSKTIQIKVVFYGPALCGKTTNLEQNFKHLNATQRLSDEIHEIPTEKDKTLKYEFLPMRFQKVKGYNLEFAVYTVPGQVKYDISRKMILKNTDGVVFVADSQRDRKQENIKSFIEMQEHLHENNLHLQKNCDLTIQFNKQDLSGVMSLEEMRNDIFYDGVETYAASALYGQGVRETFQSILSLTVGRVLNELNKSSIQKKEISL